MIQRRFFDRGVDPSDKHRWAKFLFSLNQMLDDLCGVASPSRGIVTLSGGTATVNIPTVSAKSMIWLSVNGAGTLANIGTIYEDQPSRIPGTSFTIKSTNALSDATVVWQIMDP